MMRVITLSLFIFFSLIPLANARDTECGRYCLALQVYDHTVHALALSQQQAAFEQSADQLLVSERIPLYLRYMNAYSQIIESDLNRYWLRYIRRHIPAVQLNYMMEGMSTSDALMRVNEALSDAAAASRQEVDQYLKKLSHRQIRAQRREMLQRFDTAYGLSRMRILVDQYALSYMASSLTEQAKWHPTGIHDGHLLSGVLDEVQDEHVRNETVAWLTYALRHLNDQTLKDAADLYENAGYQNLLSVTESALAPHFDRLRKRNNLASPES